MQKNTNTQKHLPIGSSNDPTAVKAQYATAKGLNTRISFHDKYSTNKQGLSNWLVSHYDIREAMPGIW